MDTGGNVFYSFTDLSKAMADYSQESKKYIQLDGNSIRVTAEKGATKTVQVLNVIEGVLERVSIVKSDKLVDEKLKELVVIEKGVKKLDDRIHQITETPIAILLRFIRTYLGIENDSDRILNQLETIKQRIAEIKTKLTILAKENELGKLREELNAVQKSVDIKLKGVSQSIEKEKAEAKKATETISKEIKEHTKTAGNKKGELADLQKKLGENIRAIDKKNQETQAEIDKLQEKTKSSKKIEELQNKIEALTFKIIDPLNENKNPRNKTNPSGTSCKLARTKKELGQKIPKAIEEIESEEKKIKELIEKQKQSCIASEARLKAIEEQKEKIKAEINGVSEKISTLEKELEELKSSVKPAPATVSQYQPATGKCTDKRVQNILANTKKEIESEPYIFTAFFGFGLGQTKELDNLFDELGAKTSDLGLKGKKLEGSAGFVNMMFVDKFMASQPKEGQTEAYQKKSQNVQEALQLSYQLGAEQTFVANNSEQIDKFAQKVKTELEQLAPGKSIFLPAGSKNHGCLLRFKKEEDGKISTTFYNTGLGSDLLGSEAAGDVAKREGVLAGIGAGLAQAVGVANASTSRVYDSRSPDELVAMISNVTQMSNQDVSMEEVTSSIQGQLGDGKAGASRREQVNGTCTFSSLQLAIEDMYRDGEAEGVAEQNVAQFNLGLHTYLATQFKEGLDAYKDDHKLLMSSEVVQKQIRCREGLLRLHNEAFINKK